MKTLEQLNSKWWYRLTKVVYVIFFILIGLVAVGIIYSENSQHEISDYRVQCRGEYTNGSSFLANTDAGIYISTYGYESVYDSLSEAEKFIIRDRCDLTKEEATALTEKAIAYAETQQSLGKTELEIQAAIDRDLRPYILVSESVPQGGWNYVIGYSLLALFIIYLIAQIIKMIFYYIVFGRIMPPRQESE